MWDGSTPGHWSSGRQGRSPEAGRTWQLPPDTGPVSLLCRLEAVLVSSILWAAGGRAGREAASPSGYFKHLGR